MQAILCHRYGPASHLEPTEVPVPEVLPGRILVRVRAASVNAYDWHRVLGEPYFVRLVDGFRGPKNPGVGADVAGVVEAVGEGVTETRPGDEVFGMSVGTFAEAVLVSRDAVVAKPANLSFEQAAAIPLAATTALQGLRDKGRLRAGERVLVHGAAGGVGHFAVQIAKALGGHVTATTSAAGLDLVRTLGADEVIDYGREDFTQLGRRFDLILDVLDMEGAAFTDAASQRRHDFAGQLFHSLMDAARRRCRVALDGQKGLGHRDGMGRIQKPRSRSRSQDLDSSDLV